MILPFASSRMPATPRYPGQQKLWVLFPTNLSSVFSIALFPEDFVTMHQLEVATGKIPVSDHDLRFIYHYCRPIKYIP